MFGEKLINNLNELHYNILEFVAIHYSTFHSITDQNVEFIVINENIRLTLRQHCVFCGYRVGFLI